MKTISLSREYDEHNQKFSVVKIRDPRFSEYLEIGEVKTWQPAPQGGVMMVEYTSAIEAYAPRLIQEPGFECLETLDFCDQIAVKDGIVELFTEARRRATKRTSSPSGEINSAESSGE